MTPTCNGYWVTLDTNDATLPPIQKCMQQAEYDAYTAKHATDNQFPGGLSGLVLVIAVVVGMFVAVWRMK